MYDQILYPTDGSEPAESILDYAFQVATEHEATIHILNVADTNRDSFIRIQGDVLDVLEEEGQQIVDEAEQQVAERGIPVVSKVIQGDPYSSIVEYSDQFSIDLIVMPTHGRRGLKRFLIGSVTERVINTVNIPIIAVNPNGGRPPTYPCQNLLVPTDGSRGAELALSEGIAIAKATDATLHLLHVVETGNLGTDVRSIPKEERLTEHANKIMTSALETAEAESLDGVESEITHGVPAHEIRTYIEENTIDLAILGTHGKTDFSRYMLGSVSAKIVRTSPIPVMWVREPKSSE